MKPYNKRDRRSIDTPPIQRRIKFELPLKKLKELYKKLSYSNYYPKPVNKLLVRSVNELEVCLTKDGFPKHRFEEIFKNEIRCSQFKETNISHFRDKLYDQKNRI